MQISSTHKFLPVLLVSLCLSVSAFHFHGHHDHEEAGHVLATDTVRCPVCVYVIHSDLGMVLPARVFEPVDRDLVQFPAIPIQDPHLIFVKGRSPPL